MNHNYTNDTMTWDENHAWVTQKTEESKCNKGNFTFSQHTN